MIRHRLLPLLLAGIVLLMPEASIASPAPPDDARGSGRVWVVEQQHPDARDDAEGSAEAPLRTIAAAAWQARPGDTVRVYTGIYRERVAPARGGAPGAPIVYEAAAGEAVTLTALEIFEPDWRPVDGLPGVVFGAFPEGLFVLQDPQREDLPDLPRSYHPFEIPLNSAPGGGGAPVDPYGHATVNAESAPVTQVAGQVFIDGQPAIQASSEAELLAVPGLWQAVPGGIRLHPPRARVPLAERQVEISTRSRCFAPYLRGLGYIHVRGFRMIGGASDFPRGFYRWEGSPQVGVLGTRSGHHWLIEDNDIRFGKSLGLDIGLEGVSDADGLGQPQPPNDFAAGTSGHHVVRGNTISDHGAGGIAGLGAYGSEITGNVIERNNRLGFTAPEIGGIKLHFFGDGLIEGNLVRDNYCYGVWLDNMYHRARVTRNAIVGNQGSGLFVELGRGPLLVDHNVIALTRPLAQQPGDGVYSHDAGGVTFTNNLVFFNAHFGLWAHVATDRKAGVWEDGRQVDLQPAQASDWNIVNNLFLGNSVGAISLPPETPRSSGNRVDHNLYAGGYPRGTVETFGALLDPASFRVNTNKLREPGDAADLTLAQWRQRTGRDLHSDHLRVLRPQLAAGIMRLNLTLGPAAERAGVAVPGLNTDYFGRPVEPSPTVGPFGPLRIEPALAKEPADPSLADPYKPIGLTRENHLLLWPQPDPAKPNTEAPGQFGAAP